MAEQAGGDDAALRRELDSIREETREYVKRRVRKSEKRLEKSMDRVRAARTTASSRNASTPPSSTVTTRIGGSRQHRGDARREPARGTSNRGPSSRGQRFTATFRLRRDRAGHEPIRSSSPSSSCPRSISSPLTKTPLSLGVVEHSQRGRRRVPEIEQSVAAGDAGMVETDVGGDAATDPGPALLDLEDPDRVLAASDQVAPRAGESLARLLEPARWQVLPGAGNSRVCVPCSCIGSKIESRRNKVPRQRANGHRVVLLPAHLGSALRGGRMPGSRHRTVDRLSDVLLAVLKMDSS